FEQLRDFVQNGGGVILFPSENGEIANYNAFLQQVNAGNYSGIVGEFASFDAIAAGNSFQDDHPVFSGLFERLEEEELRIANPDIYYFYKFRPSAAPGGFNIISMNTDDPLIREKRFGQGRVIISAIGNTPGWSNFSIRPLYAPFFYRMILYAASSDEGGFTNHVLGEELDWATDLDHSSVSLLVDDEEIIPETEIIGRGARLKYPAETWNPGWVQANDGEQSYSIAVNLDRVESDFTSYESNENSRIDAEFNVVQTFELEEESLQNEIAASGFGREIWTWFMLAGLLFLITESLVSIFYKTENV
ncbi:MAG: hypothetical protein MI700_01865, partial [Balneolales bacterium]|nr:hypothetical protein [Balneolales bacterium]